MKEKKEKRRERRKKEIEEENEKGKEKRTQNAERKRMEIGSAPTLDDRSSVRTEGKREAGKEKR